MKRARDYFSSCLCIFALMAFALMTTMCGGGGGGASGTTHALEGYIQKGPFISGTSITIQELDNDLNPTGTVYETTTSDDFGGFSLGSRIQSRYVEVIATGFYFNEVARELSAANLTLRATVDLESSESANVNVLTTLEQDRIAYLMANEGFTFEEAQAQAEGEVLNIFNISSNNISTFSQMDISKTGDNNAILLAASLILQGDNTVAELSELLSKINLDIVEDGSLDDPACTQELRENAIGVALSTVITGNLRYRYKELGLSVTIPKFKPYLTLLVGTGWNLATADPGFAPRADHTSVVYDNKIWVIQGTDGFEIRTVWYSADGVQWTRAVSQDIFSERFQHTSVVYDGKMWVIGGLDYHNVSWNDVWYSTDGVTWTEATATADFPGRYDHTSVVYDGKMWVMGGSGRNDVWYSTDGVTWTQATANADFSGRHGHTSVVYDGKMWVMGGYDGTLKNDVWYSTDGVTWTEATGNAGFSGGSGNSSVVYDNKMWVLGKTDLWYSADGVNWAKDTNDVLHPSLSHHSAVVFDDKIWLIAGYKDDEDDYSNAVWFFEYQ